jgi:ubiquinone/menaquinone biosynthesis C-methylase UbiE
LTYTPALRFHFLTPFYDFLFRILLPENCIRHALLKLYEPEKGHTLLDAGCGTGKFTTLLASQFKDATIFAIDADPAALNILSQKTAKQKIYNLNIQRQSATALSFQNHTFDAAYTSLLFCNLNDNDKHKTLQEIKRVLKPNAKLLIAEWGKPKTFYGKAGFFVLRIFGGSANLHLINKGIFSSILGRHHFKVHEKQYVNTAFGTIYFYVAE